MKIPFIKRRLGSGRHGWIGADLASGLTVALVAIPQSLAYAELAGLPAYHGLYAVALAAIAASLFASSPYLQTGPTAITSLLTFAALTPLAAAGTVEWVRLAALLALVVGVVRLLLGLLRAGPLTFFLSPPVLRGFTVGAAVLIAASQLPVLLGADAGGDGVLGRAAASLASPEAWRLEAVLVGAMTLALVLGGRRLHALFPGVLLAVGAGIAFSATGHYEGATLGTVPEGFVAFDLDLPWGETGSLLVAGFVVALIGFVEPTAIARTYAALERRPWSANRELVSQGMANVAAGVVAGLPVGGSFSRSALSHLAGARTRLSGAVTGLVVLALLPLASVLEPLPKPVLAAVILAAVVKLLDPRELIGMWRYSRPQAIIAWSTFGCTVAFAPNIELAVLIGLGLSLAIHAWREMRVRVMAELEGDELVISPQGVLWFASAESLRQGFVDQLARFPEASRLTIDLSGLGRIDYTGALAIAEMAQEGRAAGLETHVRCAPPHSERILGRVCPDLVRDSPPCDPEPPAPLR